MQSRPIWEMVATSFSLTYLFVNLRLDFDGLKYIIPGQFFYRDDHKKKQSINSTHRSVFAFLNKTMFFHNKYSTDK